MARANPRTLLISKDARKYMEVNELLGEVDLLELFHELMEVHPQAWVGRGVFCGWVGRASGSRWSGL